MVLGAAPWMSILPELITQDQRGQASAISNVVTNLCCVVGAGMGVLVGERLLPLSLCYAICFGLHVAMLPVGWVSLGVRPGWCAPEKKPTTAPPAREDGGGGCRPWATAQSFLSAFGESSAFAYMFVNGAVWTMGSVLCTGWLFYWMSDTLGCDGCEGFTVLGRTVTHSTQTALAGLAVLVTLRAIAAPLTVCCIPFHDVRTTFLFQPTLLLQPAQPTRDSISMFL